MIQTLLTTQGRVDIGDFNEKKKFWDLKNFFNKTADFVKITFCTKWRPQPEIFDFFAFECKNSGPETVFKPVSRGVFFRHHNIRKFR